MTLHMPDGNTLERLRAQAPEGPLVVLNLLKYREPEGREAFQRYGAITAGLIAAAGGELSFAGRAGPVLTGSDVDWDDVLIVRFPSAGAFLAMIEGETYTQQAAPLRAEALAHTVWLPMYPHPGF
jgi:uncharacterized protein (DUF1330 family)